MHLDPTTPAVFAIGVAMLLVAAGWRAAEHRRRRSVIRAALGAADADARIVAVHAAVDMGLASAARLLLPAIEQERDPLVRLEAALSITRRQWEPGTQSSVTQLRDWAVGELGAHGHEVAILGPAFTRLSDMGGPRLERPEPVTGTEP